jgi:hypothetical protein
MESSKPDCSGALQRKTLQSSPVAFSGALSPVRFEGKNSEIAPISCNFRRNPGGFLCASDCVAERKGFELSVRFLEPCKGPHVRDLHGLAHQQVASGELAQEPGYTRPASSFIFSSTLWIAAGLLWVLDACINISMEPFRAFVANLLPKFQPAIADLPCKLF